MAVQDILSALMGTGQAPQNAAAPLPTLTPESVKRRRLQAMMQQKEGTSYAPVQHWTQGAARVSQALLGALDEKDMDKQEATGLASATKSFNDIIGGGGGPAPAAANVPSGGTPTPPVFTRTGGQMALDPNLVQNRQFASTDETGASLNEFIESGRDMGKGNPVFHNRLLAFLNDNPAGVSIGDLDRDRAAQEKAYAKFLAGGPRAAVPGSSNHEHGAAADLSYEDNGARQWALQNAQRYGLHFPLANKTGRDREDWHVEPIETRKGAKVVAALSGGSEGGGGDGRGGGGANRPDPSTGFNTPIGQNIYPQGFKAPLDTSVPLGDGAPQAPAQVAQAAPVPLPPRRPESFGTPAASPVVAALAAQSTGAVAPQAQPEAYAGSGMDSGNSIIPQARPQAPQARPQMASVDPSVMAQATPQQAPQAAQAQANPIVQQVTQLAAQPQVQQAAQAHAQTPEGQRMVQQAGGASLPQIMQAMQNPWMSEGQKSLLLMVAKQKMEAMDPVAARMRQLQLQEAEQKVNGKPEWKQIGQDDFGRPQYGFVNEQKGAVTPFKPAPGADSGAPVMVPGPNGPVAVPKGQDPAIFRKTLSERAAADAAGPKYEDVSNLRKEVQGLPSYKNLAQAAPVYKSMLDAAGRDTKAADLNMVYGLGKIMDPGSVVREGEIVMANDTGGFQDKLNGFIKGIQGEGRLRPEVREGLMREAYGRIQSYKQMYDQDATHFTGVATRAKMNVQDVLPDFGSFDEYKPAPAAKGAEDGWKSVNPNVRFREKK